MQPDQWNYIEMRRSGTKWLSAMFDFLFDAFVSNNFLYTMRQVQLFLANPEVFLQGVNGVNCLVYKDVFGLS